MAIIGTSRTPGKGGYNIIENLLRLQYAGGIYPVNPRAEEILGLNVYPDLEVLPETPDLALIVLPPSQVLTSFRECVDRGIKAVIIESAGFSEMADRLPDFFKKEKLSPHDATFDVPDAELDTVYNFLK